MSDFVISDGVPLPVQPEQAPKRRGRPPGSKNKPKGLGLTCPTNDSHSWNGATLEPEICSRCGAEFPCRGECAHVDCMESKGLPLPDWYVENQANPRPWLAVETEITEVSSSVPLAIDEA